MQLEMHWKGWPGGRSLPAASVREREGLQEHPGKRGHRTLGDTLQNVMTPPENTNMAPGPELKLLILLYRQNPSLPTPPSST